MFVKIRDYTYVNLELVKGITLSSIVDNYCWIFWIDEDPIAIESDYFKTEEEALEWFEENIDPAITAYNGAKFAPHEMNLTLEDINSNLQCLLEKQED